MLLLVKLCIPLNAEYSALITGPGMHGPADSMHGIDAHLDWCFVIIVLWTSVPPVCSGDNIALYLRVHMVSCTPAALYFID